MMFLIDTLPTKVAASHIAFERDLAGAVARGDLASAVNAAAGDYKLLEAAQPPGRRYHKGWSLHNLGLYQLLTGDGDGGLRQTLRAFVEDALSRAEESADLDELCRPAARNLLYVYGLPGPLVADVAREARLMVASGRLIQRPEDMFDERRVRRLLSVAPETWGKRVPGLFNSAQEDRVFVGGNYGGALLTTVLAPIRDQLRSSGRDGVLVSDFVIPSGMGVDEHALMLLRSCHCAVFDFTERGGQEQEFADLPDSMRERTLLLYDSRVPGAPKVSGGMTKAKMDRWGIAAVPFDSAASMASAVGDFLTSKCRR